MEDELLTYRYYVLEEGEEVERVQAVQKVVDTFIDTMQVLYGIVWYGIFCFAFSSVFSVLKMKMPKTLFLYCR